MVDMGNINNNDPNSVKYSKTFLRVNTITVTKNLLNSSDVPDIASIPISSEYYKK